jgi:hypothetical protein
MRGLRAVVLGFGLGLWASFGCGNKAAPEQATRADCEQVSQHIADLIIKDATRHPHELWDRAHAVGETFPEGVTKDSFKAWLETTPEGATWLMQRRGQTLAATQQGIDTCVANANKQHVRCLLAAKSRADVDACDEAAQQQAKPAS